MTTTQTKPSITLPNIVTRDEWRKERIRLLEKEKAATRARDALNAERRRLPMVEIEEDYRFQGPGGPVTLLDLFGAHRQLIVYHFMWLWDGEEPRDLGCPSCSAGADEISEGLLEHLHARDTSLVYVSRGPLEKIEAYKAKKKWTFPFYSSYGSRFNFDFHVSFDESVAPIEYNYRSKEDWVSRDLPLDEWKQPFDLHGHSCFLRDGDRVFHTYSMYGRGAETLGGSYYFLDITALGRQESWEQPKDRVRTERDATPDFAE